MHAQRVADCCSIACSVLPMSSSCTSALFDLISSTLNSGLDIKSDNTAVHPGVCAAVFAMSNSFNVGFFASICARETTAWWPSGLCAMDRRVMGALLCSKAVVMDSAVRGPMSLAARFRVPSAGDVARRLVRNGLGWTVSSKVPLIHRDLIAGGAELGISALAMSCSVFCPILFEPMCKWDTLCAIALMASVMCGCCVLSEGAEM
eukprot:3749495-Rhodomonas_salina.2